MDFIDESGYIADSSDISEEESNVQTKSITARAAEIITESLENKEHLDQGSMQDKPTKSFSSASQTSPDLNDTVIAKPDSCVRVSAPCLNEQLAKSQPVKKHSQTHSVRSSSQVSDVTHDSTLTSPRQCPPLQAMDRSAPYEPGRISSSVFTANSTPREWSMASNESLFSLHIGHMAMKNGVSEMGSQNRQSSFALSDEVISNRASTVTARQENTRNAVNTTGGQFKPSTSDKVPHDLIIQRIHDHADTKARIIPETPWDPRNNIGKVQPMQTSERNKKPEKPSSCCKNWRSCLCSCASLSCCCSASDFCCSTPKCSCSLKWCCNSNCCPKKSCFSNGSCCCPKRSFCLSCNQCSNAICCWNWSCWKLFCFWNWTCCSKEPCCAKWSCCSKGSCCKPLSCCSEVSCCKSWSCSSMGACCGSWNCCSKGTCCPNWNCCSCGSCCKSWNCCSMESCCKSWNCCPCGSCCRSWNCCPSGSCCKSWSCCPSRSCCKSWSCCPSRSCCKSWNCCPNRLCCFTGSCCPTWKCCFKGLCSWNCGSCFQTWNCCSTDVCCCKSFKIKLCCFSSSTKPQAARAEPELPHQDKTKTSRRTGKCGWLPCSGM